MEHEIIIGVVILSIVIGQIWIFLKTKLQIELFKSIFPSKTFKTINVFIPEVKISEISCAEIWTNAYKYTTEPSKKDKELFTVKVDGEGETYLISEFGAVVNKYYSKSDFQILFKKGSKSTFVNYSELQNMRESGWSIATEKYDYIKLTLIQNTVVNNPILQKILDSINTYLLKNKDAVSDFNLVKDIVERNCDAEDEQINTLLPIPLYLGLMGTMLGIIVGVGYMAIEGFDSFLGSAVTEVSNEVSKTNGIEVLMGSVGVAMIASLVGLALTTIASGWFYKGAKSEVEGLKNDFFTFIQTELLPTISNNATNSLATLQTNLLKFNEGFTRNVDKFDGLLIDILSSFKSQMSIVEELKEIDVAKLARLNIDVLRELRASTLEFEKFNQYLGKVNEVVDNATRLNTTLKSDLDHIEVRKDAVQHAFVKINDTFESGIKLLKESNDDRLAEVKKATISHQDSFEKYMNESALTLQTIVDEKTATVAAQIKQNNEILIELQKQTELRSSIDRISGTLKDQNNSLIEFRRVVQDLSKKIENIGDSKYGLSKGTKIIAYTFMGSTAAVSIGFIFYKLTVWGAYLFNYLF